MAVPRDELAQAPAGRDVLVRLAGDAQRFGHGHCSGCCCQLGTNFVYADGHCKFLRSSNVRYPNPTGDHRYEP